jgi:hypothetical protein
VNVRPIQQIFRHSARGRGAHIPPVPAKGYKTVYCAIWQASLASREGEVPLQTMKSPSVASRDRSLTPRICLYWHKVSGIPAIHFM